MLILIFNSMDFIAHIEGNFLKKVDISLYFN